MADLLLSMRRVDEAVDFQRRAVELAEQMGHQALRQMRAFLTELEQTGRG